MKGNNSKPCNTKQFSIKEFSTLIHKYQLLYFPVVTHQKPCGLLFLVWRIFLSLGDVILSSMHLGPYSRKCSLSLLMLHWVTHLRKIIYVQKKYI